jgi:hypothetical protein
MSAIKITLTIEISEDDVKNKRVWARLYKKYDDICADYNTSSIELFDVLESTDVKQIKESITERILEETELCLEDQCEICGDDNQDEDKSYMSATDVIESGVWVGNPDECNTCRNVAVCENCREEVKKAKEAKKEVKKE